MPELFVLPLTAAGGVPKLGSLATMRLRMPRMLCHGACACACMNSTQLSITFVAASPIMMRLMMTALLDALILKEVG